MFGRFETPLRAWAHGLLRRSRRASAGPAPETGRPAPLEPEWLRSLEDHQRLVARLGDDAWNPERALAAAHADGAFKVPGYCWVDALPVAFEMDYRYAHEHDGTRTPNWRERMVCPVCRLNNRQRAALHLATETLGLGERSRVYITEQVTAVYALLRSRVPALVGSEFLGPNAVPGEVNAQGIRHEDLTRLSFPDGSLDAILSFDVLEHIPDFRKALVECHRVLAPAGAMLLSVPFLEDHPVTRTRARIDAQGHVIHDLPPVHHGDPVNPGAGVLCFHEFGWDLLAQLRAAGFARASALAFRSPDYGYLGGIPLAFAAWKA